MVKVKLCLPYLPDGRRPKSTERNCPISSSTGVLGKDQKRTDMRDFHVDTFVMGDDWEGEFDFLREEGVD